MATITAKRASIRAGVSIIVWLPEAASQSYKAGQLVYLSSGTVTVVASNGTTIYGMAMADASGTTSALSPIAVIGSDTVLEMTMVGAYAEATPCGSKLAVAVTSNITYVDDSDTSNDALVIIGLAGDGTNGDSGVSGDTQARVLVKILAAVNQSSGITAS